MEQIEIDRQRAQLDHEKWDRLFDHLPIYMGMGSIVCTMPVDDLWARVIVATIIVLVGIKAVAKWPVLRLTRYMRRGYVVAVSVVGGIALTLVLGGLW